MLLHSALFLLAWSSACAHCSGSDADEFKVKRKEVFEFASAPKMTRRGDRVEIAFTARDYCDATVAIEKADGTILRHLASGVLGPHVPEPFQKSALEQHIVWDGKDDQGSYIDDKEHCVARVSLGLQPLFERSLLSVPQRRLGSWQSTNTFDNLPVPLMVAAPEGVYVFEAAGVEQLRLFDRDGKYLRTVYPFPAIKLDQVVGLSTRVFPQDGQRLPLKLGFCQATLLTSGVTGQKEDRGRSMYGAAATAMAVRGNRIALTLRSLNRLATDGTTGGLPLSGPGVMYPVPLKEQMNRRASLAQVSPLSLAFSPDTKWLYLTGYMYRDFIDTIYGYKDCLHGVVRLNFEKDEPPALFAGSMEPRGKGADNQHFTDATSVACDAQGRVYVTDYMNDRIQVYSPAGKLLKSIAVFKPVRLDIHQRTGELYVFSWTLHHDDTLGLPASAALRIPARLFKLGAFDNPKMLAAYELPLAPKGKNLPDNLYRPYYYRGETWGGLEFSAVLDSWADPARVWIVRGGPFQGPSQFEYIRIYEERGDKLEQIGDFSKPVAETFKKFVLPKYWRQRLYANPKNGLLYVAEQHTAAREKAFREVLEVNPKDGKTRLMQLPFDAEDMAIGPTGLFYLRERVVVARYDPEGFREVPFDYGEERQKVSSETSSGARYADLVSGLPIYCGTGWHIGGMYVSVKEHLGISCYVTKGDGLSIALRTDGKAVPAGAGGWVEDGQVRGRVFVPKFYPGRLYWGEIHIFDKHGHLAFADLVPGLVDLYGLGVDKDDNVYLNAAPTRILDGVRYFNELSGTLLKFQPGKGRIRTTSQHEMVPLKIAQGMEPKGNADLIKGDKKFWVEGADWKYGGVGFCGKNATYAMGGCACFNSRFYLDYFGRSFAPEVERCQVAVLDSNGNLILRVGRYGNADSAGPVSPVPLGGDEVGLFYAPYVATLTDRYLWIADPGNQRISSVRLDYHTNVKIPLKDVPDADR